MQLPLDRSRRIEILLNTLAHERVARRALVLEVVEELASSPPLDGALRVARDLADALDEGSMNDDDFETAVSSVRSEALARARGTLASVAESVVAA